MTECKHGLKQGCSYCHARPVAGRPASIVSRPAAPKRGRPSSLSEKMNDRMTQLNRRLREIRGE